MYEKSDRIGGLLRYGIPDFKMEKWVIDRRLEQMKAEGVEFKTGVHVGVDLDAEALRKQYDAVCLTLGAERRDALVGLTVGSAIHAGHEARLRLMATE